MLQVKLTAGKPGSGRMKFVTDLDKGESIIIGKRFTGKPAIAQDFDTGDYSESLPLIQGDMLKLQRCLLESKNV